MLVSTKARTNTPCLGTALGLVIALVTACGSPWQAPTAPPANTMPSDAVSTVTIPATVSAFHARNAKVYLPPGYGTTTELPPVLMLLSGVPGDVSDWFDQGDTKETLDEFAKAHAGRAPVIVAPDDIGEGGEDLLCMDSPLGNVDSYLSQDVPAWLKNHLHVDPDTRTWAVGGVSYGGTCAYQLAVRHPALFPTFLDFSGEKQPTRVTRETAVDEVFHGDSAAYDRQDPVTILMSQRFPDSAGTLAVGDDDAPYTDEQPMVLEACQRAGMKMEASVLSGGHDWDVWATAFRQSLPWLAHRMRLDVVRR